MFGIGYTHVVSHIFSLFWLVSFNEAGVTGLMTNILVICALRVYYCLAVTLMEKLYIFRSMLIKRLYAVSLSFSKPPT